MISVKEMKVVDCMQIGGSLKKVSTGGLSGGFAWWLMALMEYGGFEKMKVNVFLWKDLWRY